MESHNDHFLTIQSQVHTAKERSLENKFSTIVCQLDSAQQRAIFWAKDEKMSSWLSVLPSVKHHFDLPLKSFGMPWQFVIENPYLRYQLIVMDVAFPLTFPMLFLLSWWPSHSETQ